MVNNVGDLICVHYFIFVSYFLEKIYIFDPVHHDVKILYFAFADCEQHMGIFSEIVVIPGKLQFAIGNNPDIAHISDKIPHDVSS